MTNGTSDLDALQLSPLPGSERDAAPGAEPAAQPLDLDTRVELTLVLRRRAALPDPLARLLSPSELRDSYGASPDDGALVISTLTSLGLEIVGSHLGSRRVRVAGTVDRLSTVFGTTLSAVSSTDPMGSPIVHRGRAGGLSVPRPLAGIVTAVLGLDDRPQARMLLRVAAPGAVTTSYSPVDLGVVYRFPPDTDGTGQTIAVIELGGGFDSADLDAYFSGLAVSGPTVTAVSVDGARNQPGRDPNGADGEVLLDIEVAGALAPGARQLVYFAPNTDAGFVDAVSEAAHADPPPTAISISWGLSEDSWTGQARTALDQAVADAVALGVTVTCASGDDGSVDRTTDGRVHVDFPASSPHALACGGTRLDADPASGAVRSETVWNNGVGNGATGGGISDVFALPAWQRDAGVPAPDSAGGRGVPDVAAVADPQTGYRVRVDGRDLVIGGTSAVAPLWAALVTRLAERAGRRLGLLQPALYAGAHAGTAVPGFRDVTEGDNGAYSAGRGWDPCTGLGVPDGAALVDVLSTG